jgi:hypothetical protein
MMRASTAKSARRRSSAKRKRHPQRVPFYITDIRFDQAYVLDSASDELASVAKGLNGFSSVVWNLNPKLFFECHDQFNGIKAVRAQIVNERGIFNYLVLFDAQMLDDDLLYAVSDVAHVNSSCSYGKQSPAFSRAHSSGSPRKPPGKPKRVVHSGRISAAYITVFANGKRFRLIGFMRSGGKKSRGRIKSAQNQWGRAIMRSPK